MKLLSVFWVAAVVLAAGCAAPTEEPADQEEEPCLVEAADDFSCAGMDGAPDERPHLHDYWGGLDRLEFQGMTAPLGGLYCTELSRVAVLHPADGDAVIQGTAAMEVTVSWTDPQPYEARGPIELWVRTAADAEPWHVAVVERGQTVIIETTNDQNDLPHQRLSAWEFHIMVQAASPVGCTAYPTPLPPGLGDDFHAFITLEVAIERGHDIPLHPGHPDRWRGMERLALLEQEASVFFAQSALVGACLIGPGGEDCLDAPHRPEDRNVVPHDASLVVVTIESLGGSPLLVGLAYHDAKTRELTALQPSEDTGGLRVYRIAVGPGGDGPYALQSQWEFWPFPDNASGTYSGSYRITAESWRTAEG